MGHAELPTTRPTSARVDCFRDVSKPLLAVAAGILVFLLQIDLSQGFADNLDAGWQEVLNWGVAQGAQWGEQLAFTYGPLGFIAPGQPLDPRIFWLTLVLQLVFAAVVAWLVAANLRRMPWSTASAFVAATIVFGWSLSSSATLLLVYPLAILVLERASRDTASAQYRRCARVALLATFAALQPLIKFSAFPLWLAWLVLGAVIVWRSGKRPLFATFVLASILAPVITWAARGQHLGNLPLFLDRSWEVAKYYEGAMQADPSAPTVDHVALGAVAFGLVCAMLFAWRQRHDLRRIAVYTMFAVWLALSYRAGALRADEWHLLLLWSTLAWCAPLLIGTWIEYDTSSVGVRKGVAAAALALLALTPLLLAQIYSASIVTNLYTGRYAFNHAGHTVEELLNPHALHARSAKAWTADRAALALPQIDRAVGRDSIDVLTNAQSSLLANNLNYDPRPVFQSYSAYSGHLAKLNADFFLSSRAPRWVMASGYAIGRRYPTSDDAQALVRIMQNYQPVLSEGAFLLFRRREVGVHAPIASVEPDRVLPIGFHSPTDIPAAPGNAWYARLNVKLTPYGKLQALLFRPPTLEVAVTLKGGSQHRYTLIRSIAHSGFMLSPALGSNAQYLTWLQGNNAQDVVSVRLLQSRVLNHKAFKVKGALRLYALDLPRKQERTLALYANFYPGFDRMPVSMSGSPGHYTVDGHDVMFLPPPGSSKFDLPAGTYQVSVKFGLMPNALTNQTCLAAHPDGIGIWAGIAGEAPTPGATQSLDPFTDPKHRYSATYSRTLTVAKDQTVQIVMTNGASGNNGVCDWSWLRDIHFTRITHLPVKPKKLANSLSR